MIDHLTDQEIQSEVANYKATIAWIEDEHLRESLAISFQQGIVRCLMALQEKEACRRLREIQEQVNRAKIGPAEG